MKILVTGGTGTVGSQVVSELLKRNAQVSVLTRRPDAKLPPGVEAEESVLRKPRDPERGESVRDERQWRGPEEGPGE